MTSPISGFSNPPAQPGLKSPAARPISGATPVRPEQTDMKIDPARPGAAARTSAGGEVRPPEAARGPGQAAPDAAIIRSRPSTESAQPFDRTRVEALRSAVADGSYQPNAERIADALLGIEVAMRGGTR